jgi:hypothetical protein
MNAPTPERPAPFPVTRIAHVEERERGAAWLVEHLWAEEAVGFIAAAPKTGKTWLSIELAVAVATGHPCLGHFPVPRRGHVLLFAAEDTHDAIKRRVKDVARVRGVEDFERLAIGLLAVPELRLDRDEHLRRLDATLAQLKPRLLILDPLVRLHRGDENSAGEISALLGNLRALQRAHKVAIALVHHVRKSPTDQPGQSLRGSGDLHAWSDSSLYLLRRKQGVELRVEHRAHPPPEPFLVELSAEPAAHLRLLDAPPAREPGTDLERRVLAALVNQPLTRTTLREVLGVRNETLGLTLSKLEAAGRVRRSDSLLVPVPAP